MACASDDGATPVTPADGPPNILLILADDQRYDDVEFMPQTRARLGSVLTRAYATTSLCCPARTTILRGQYSHNHGIFSNDVTRGGGWPTWQARGLESSTIAVWLDGAGYATGLFGKYVNGFGPGNTFMPPGWDEFFVTDPRGSYTVDEVGDNSVWRAIPPTYVTDLVTERAMSWITGRVEADIPWFAFVSHQAPHGPTIPEPRYAGTLSHLPPPRPPSFNVPLSFRSLRGIPFSADSIALLDDEYRRRLETLRSLDDAVVQMLDSLEAMGQLSKTLVIFTSDNGYLLGEHAEYGKNAPWEESIHIPMLVAGPGVVRGERSQLVGLLDLAPTIADYAGVSVPSFVDGRSLRPVLQGAAGSWRSALLIEHLRFEGIRGSELETKAPRQRGVRTRDWYYSEWELGGVTEHEVYDTRTDPWQTTNLWVVGGTNTRFDWMRDLTTRLHECERDACRAVENTPLPNGAARSGGS